MPNGLQIKFIKDAMDCPEALSDWENEFIDSLADLDDDVELSEKQNKVLNRTQTKLERYS